MRSYSFFTIVLLCIAIVIIDIIAFYWLQDITDLANSVLFQSIINVLFFTFTIGLVGAILFLKIRLDAISERRKHLVISSLYGLTISSFIPKVLFIIFASVLYYSNYVFSYSQSIWVLPISGLMMGFFPFFVILYAIFKTLYHFKISKIKLPLERLPASFDSLRIVQISDLHLGSFNYKCSVLEKAFTAISDLKPDIIVFTGDLVNNYAWELEGWEDVFKKLHATIGKFAVLGNHDYGDYSTWESEEAKKKNAESIVEFFKKINFKLLLNESHILNIEELQIALIGVENWGNPPFKQYGDLQKAMKPIKTNPIKILLSHDPSHWEKEVLLHTDIVLTLSGHTHGMQAGVTFKSKSWSPIKYRYKHWDGLYTQNSQYLYVNRGMGWLGFPGRVGMRPEISCIDIVRKQ